MLGFIYVASYRLPPKSDPLAYRQPFAQTLHTNIGRVTRQTTQQVTEWSFIDGRTREN